MEELKKYDRSSLQNVWHWNQILNNTEVDILDMKIDSVSNKSMINSILNRYKNRYILIYVNYSHLSLLDNLLSADRM